MVFLSDRLQALPQYYARYATARRVISFSQTRINIRSRVMKRGRDVYQLLENLHSKTSFLFSMRKTTMISKRNMTESVNS